MPTAWSGKFDFVQQKLLTSGLTLDDWRIALREVHRVLAPGGWVQFLEPGAWNAGPATDQCWNVMVAVHKANGGDLQVGKMLPDLLASLGFVSITEVDCPVALYGSSEDAARARFTTKGVVRAMKTAVLKAEGVGLINSEEEYEEMLQTAEKEWSKIEGARKGFTLVYAQKPVKA